MVKAGTSQANLIPDCAPSGKCLLRLPILSVSFQFLLWGRVDQERGLVRRGNQSAYSRSILARFFVGLFPTNF